MDSYTDNHEMNLLFPLFNKGVKLIAFFNKNKWDFTRKQSIDHSSVCFSLVYAFSIYHGSLY